MKITQPVNIKNRVLKYGIIILVVVGIASAAAAYWLNNTGQTPSDGPTPAQKKEMQAVDNANKKDFAEKTKDTDNPGVTVPTPSSPDTIDLSASKTDTSTVTIFTKLKNYASGNCELTVTNGTRTYSATAQILYQPEYSSCAGFSIPVSELDAGTWTIKLIATPTGGTPITKTISSEVK